MFAQDYIMRLVHEIARVLAKILFNIDSETVSEKLESRIEETDILEQLLDMVDSGQINEAENKLYDLLNTGVPNCIETAILFYSYLNEKSDEFLKENDYSTAYVGLDPSYFGTTSGDCIPVVDPLDAGNKVMYYKQSYYAKGALFLGAEFETNNVNVLPSLVKDKTVQAKANVAYEVEFDYYATGTPSNAMDISIAVGDNTSEKNADGPMMTISYSKVVKTLPANKDATTDGWVRDQKAVITIPSDVDFANGKYLMLYMTHGKGASVYFDNIKVTALAGVEVKYVTDTETKTIFYADGVVKDYMVSNAQDEEAVWYLDAEFTQAFDVSSYERTGEYYSLMLYGKWTPFEYTEDTVLFESGYEVSRATELSHPRTEEFYQTSGDLSPIPDATGGNHGNVLWYRQNWYGIGKVVLGWEYDNPKAVTPVTLHKGMTYQVSFLILWIIISVRI